MKDIKVLIFSSDNYNLQELDNMTEAERYELASVAKGVGYDETDVMTLTEFQRLFNDGTVNNTSCYVFFYQEG